MQIQKHQCIVLIRVSNEKTIDRWLGWNTDYKYHSKDTHFRWKIKWRLELLGALVIIGDALFDKNDVFAFIS